MNKTEQLYPTLNRNPKSVDARWGFISCKAGDRLEKLDQLKDHYSRIGYFIEKLEADKYVNNREIIAEMEYALDLYIELMEGRKNANSR